MHPVENIRSSRSSLLDGRRIVLGVTGSIAAVKCVELARELIRHGAEVHAVMSDASKVIIGPESLHFGTGNPVIATITGGVEHVAMLGDVPRPADLFLVAPATANSISKMALGIDDGPVTTMATVAFGHHRPVVVAPAMHEGMMEHPKVAKHIQDLLDMGVTWVEPSREEHKAKLADIESIVDHVIHALARRDTTPRKCLVIGGATAEAIDPVRVMTNRSSGKTATALAQELFRAGHDVELWYGQGSAPVPAALRDHVRRFTSHADLMAMAKDATGFEQIWMPAAISDYVPEASDEKIASEGEPVIRLRPVEKVIEAVRAVNADATLIAFKAESAADTLVERARGRLERYGADYIIANTSAAFGADNNDVWLLGKDGRETRHHGDKAGIYRAIIRELQ